MDENANLSLNEDATVKDVLGELDDSGAQIALIVNTENKLLGTVTDGDVRRALLSGCSLKSLAVEVMNKSFYCVSEDLSDREAIKLMRTRSLRHIPIVDNNGVLLEIKLLDNLIKPTSLPNAVVIMAGGMGKRLMPLTEKCPKPMLSVNGKPMLEILIEQCVDSGFTQFYISVNYLKDMIIDYFQDGSRWNVDIDYLIEDKPLGTAGSLQLLPKEIEVPFLVLNGDVLTRLDPIHLLQFHQENLAKATMCIREYEVTVPFGVVEANGIEVESIKEKPVYKYLVNAGVYVVEPEILGLVPKNESIDMPNFLQLVKSQGHRLAVCPIHEYWIDVGRPESLEEAHLTWPAES